jgi:hypothetical protein
MFKQILLWIAGTFVALQAIQIDIPEPPKTIDPNNEITAPDNIMSMLKTSCYDCHSYRTKMPWYGHISPASLEVKSHIKNGRIAVNFQEWGTYDEAKKQKIFKGIVQTINFRMPMPMYLMVHKEAKLNREERAEIKKWAQSHLRENAY